MIGSRWPCSAEAHLYADLRFLRFICCMHVVRCHEFQPVSACLFSFRSGILLSIHFTHGQPFTLFPQTSGPSRKK